MPVFYTFPERHFAINRKNGVINELQQCNNKKVYYFDPDGDLLPQMPGCSLTSAMLRYKLNHLDDEYNDNLGSENSTPEQLANIEIVRPSRVRRV
jgi:hypothetical protein